MESIKHHKIWYQPLPKLGINIKIVSNTKQKQQIHRFRKYLCEILHITSFFTVYALVAASWCPPDDILALLTSPRHTDSSSSPLCGPNNSDCSLPGPVNVSAFLYDHCLMSTLLGVTSGDISPQPPPSNCNLSSHRTLWGTSMTPRAEVCSGEMLALPIVRN